MKLKTPNCHWQLNYGSTVEQMLWSYYRNSQTCSCKLKEGTREDALFLPSLILFFSSLFLITFLISTRCHTSPQLTNTMFSSEYRFAFFLNPTHRLHNFTPHISYGADSRQSVMKVPGGWRCPSSFRSSLPNSTVAGQQAEECGLSTSQELVWEAWAQGLCSPVCFCIIESGPP